MKVFNYRNIDAWTSTMHKIDPLGRFHDYRGKLQVIKK